MYVYVHLRHIVLLALRIGDKLIRTLDAVDVVRASLDHPLIDQSLKWLILTDDSEVVEELIPKATIDQVTRSMLRTANVEIHLSPVAISFGGDQSGLILRIHIA